MINSKTGLIVFILICASALIGLKLNAIENHTSIINIIKLKWFIFKNK